MGKDIVDAESFQEFADTLRQILGIRVTYAGKAATLAGQGGPEGRIDGLFQMHSDDGVKFSMPKIRLRARWWGDIYFNDGKHI